MGPPAPGSDFQQRRSLIRDGFAENEWTDSSVLRTAVAF